MERDRTSVLNELADWAKINKGKPYKDTKFEVLPKALLSEDFRKEVGKIIGQVINQF